MDNFCEIFVNEFFKGMYFGCEFMFVCINIVIYFLWFVG